MFFMVVAMQVDAQTKDTCPKDTVIVLGEKEIRTSEVKMTKRAFLSNGKIDVNHKDCSVEQYTYSMFALGNNIRQNVQDSLLPTQMKNAVLDNRINYRYINLEGITIRRKDGSITTPVIDTVKVKFVYQ